MIRRPRSGSSRRASSCSWQLWSPRLARSSKALVSGPLAGSFTSPLGAGNVFGLATSLPPSALGLVIAGRREHLPGLGLDPVEVAREGPLLVLRALPLDSRKFCVPFSLDAFGL